MDTATRIDILRRSGLAPRVVAATLGIDMEDVLDFESNPAAIPAVGPAALGLDEIADGQVPVYDAAQEKFVSEATSGTLLTYVAQTAASGWGAGVAETSATKIALPNFAPLVFEMPEGTIRVDVMLKNISTDANGLGRNLTFTLRDTDAPNTERAVGVISTPTSIQAFRYYDQALFDNSAFAAGATVSLTLMGHINPGTDTAVLVNYSATQFGFLAAYKV
jgi:hypothetical protein